MYFVIFLLILVAILFATDKIRPDFIALAALCVLILSGTLSTQEALSAFGNTTVILVATLFIIGKGLTLTGITQAIGNQISFKIKEKEENKLIAVLMATVGLVGSFMSSTGIVALFVPVVKKIASNNNFNIKRLLIPVAYAGLISGMMTLISTAPNLIVSEELSSQGYEPFSMLDFTPIGIAMLIAAIAYFLVKSYFFGEKQVDKTNLGSERMKLLLKDYNIPGEIFRLQVTETSEYNGKKIYETDLRKKYNLNVLGIESGEVFSNSMTIVGKETVLHKDQILYVHGSNENATRICEDKSLTLLPYLGVHSSILKQQVGLAELVIPDGSSFIDKTIIDIGSTRFTHFNLLGSKRLKSHSMDNLKNHHIKTGESLLILGSKDDIAKLNNKTNDYIVFNIPFEQVTEVNTTKALTSIAITSLMIIFLVVNIIPPVMTVLIAALLMIATRCISMEEAYGSINWSTVILIAAMLPFAMALEKTGGITFIADGVLDIFGHRGPYIIVTVLFVITVILGSFLSNTATAVIFAPIAIKIAEASDISPYPLAMTIAIAASSAYLTPIASPVNMLVVAPGGYKFMDFVKVGLPMFVIALLISLFLIPILFPF